jgi:FkbM family methyltransferase
MIKSYSQNFEDVIIYNALAGKSDGFYIDVGAGDPTHDSVTRGLYDIGWSGINIEPLLERYTDLVSQRTRDINLRVALSDFEGKTELFSVLSGRGELSTISPEIKTSLIDSGEKGTQREVAVTTLSSVIRDFAPSDVHLLKIDVEGAETSVLKGADFALFRPWIVVVEIKHGRATESQEAIQQFFEEKSYLHAHFDGLNSYFVASEKADSIVPRIGIPFRDLERFERPNRELEAISVLNQVAALIGATSQDNQEIVVRLEQYVSDRETLINDLRATSRFTDDEIAMQKRLIAHLESQAFSRERMLSNLAGQLAAARWAQTQAEQKVMSLELSLDGAGQAIAIMKKSTSWKISLPIRVMRRPMHYLRALVPGER